MDAHKREYLAAANGVAGRDVETARHLQDARQTIAARWQRAKARHLARLFRVVVACRELDEAMRPVKEGAVIEDRGLVLRWRVAYTAALDYATDETGKVWE